MSSRIAAYWRTGWLAGRFDHARSQAAFCKRLPWKLSEKIPVQREVNAIRKGTGYAARYGAVASAYEAITFWRTLARAGHCVCSDQLSTSDLD